MNVKKSLGAKPLIFPAPVLIVGSYDSTGKPNLLTAAYGGICCSQPPCISVSLSKKTYSYSCIVERNAFTVGIACEAKMTEADYVGVVSGRDVDKFTLDELTLVKSEQVDAPYAAEFPVVLECRLLQTIEMGQQDQFIGEIIDVKADPNVCGEDGLLDIMKIKPLIFDTSHMGYHGVGPLLAKAFSVGKGLAS